MADEYKVGDQVEVRLDKLTNEEESWFSGRVIRIEPYSTHRSFHWVELDEDTQAIAGVKQISVFNPKNIRKI